jgi:hypothetical protein
MEQLGTTLFFAILVTAAIIWHVVRKKRREAVAWTAVGVLIYCLKMVLKGYLARPRPALWPTLITEPDYAFPSGHALGAAAFYPLLAWTVFGAGSKRRRLYVALAVFAALIVGVSRLYLGLHWPTDVLAGWAIGFTVCASAIIWLETDQSVPNEVQFSPPHLPPWSVMPLEGLKGLGNPPILGKDKIILFFGIGAAAGYGITFLPLIEPFTFGKASAALIAWWFVVGLTFLTTVAFGYKQWSYYKRDSGVGKEGIFVRTVGMVNRREEMLDLILCGLGGLLLGVSHLPSVWLVVLAFYSAAVAVRAQLVRWRPVYYERLERQGVHVPPLYRRFECSHNGYWVPAVMLGWVYVHTAIAVTAVAAAGFFLVDGFRLKPGATLAPLLGARFIVGLGLVGESVKLSTMGYRLGLRRCPAPPDQAGILPQAKSGVVTASSPKKEHREHKGGNE